MGSGAQVDAEGWTSEHDDRHTSGELLSAAAVYMGEIASTSWPWGDTVPKISRYHTTRERVRELVKAGALIAAEIDRLQRLAPEGADDEGNGT